VANSIRRAGSPFITAKRLEGLAQRGYTVRLLLLRKPPALLQAPRNCSQTFSLRAGGAKDCFSDVANNCSIRRDTHDAPYIDPCDVVQLSLSKLRLVFDKVRQNSSVEALIVFMARAFMRQGGPRPKRRDATRLKRARWTIR